MISKKESKVEGLIISNTTIDRPQLSNKEFMNETGGLSGKPLAYKSTEMIKEMYKLTKGKITNEQSLYYLHNTRFSGNNCLKLIIDKLKDTTKQDVTKPGCMGMFKLIIDNAFQVLYLLLVLEGCLPDKMHMKKY